MANDNNNINGLVSDSDGASTAKMETLASPSESGQPTYNEPSEDEDTFDFDQLGEAADRLEDTAETVGPTEASLKSDIRSQKEVIEQLQFDIEQLRARHSALETEINARESLTGKLNSQIADTRHQLEQAAELRIDSDAKIDLLKSSLKEKNTLFTSFEKEIRNVSDMVESGKSVIDELQNKVIDQKKVIRNLGRERAAINSKKNVADKLLAAKDSKIAGLESTLSGSLADVAAYAKELLSLKSTLATELQKNEELVAALCEAELSTENENRQLQTGQEGLIASNSQEVRELKQQIIRTESYADEIRMKLHDLVASADDTVRSRHQFDSALRESTEQSRELQEQLDNEVLHNSDLRKQNEQMKSDFDNEIRLIRFELGGAEQTIASQESMNEQLASDLIDNQGYRQALESQLENTDRENRKKVADLSQKLKRIEQSNEDIERKLTNKDNAVAALLSELANRSRVIRSDGESEKIMHEIDGRKSDDAVEEVAVEKDRMARLLIGNVEGQELRFPLFKDRLSIGRTNHNDIQLKAHFVSRRHAVIVTESKQTRIIDWGSKNGVYVNDLRIAEQNLKNGDIVAIGTAEFRYEERPKR